MPASVLPKAPSAAATKAPATCMATITLPFYSFRCRVRTPRNVRWLPCCDVQETSKKHATNSQRNQRVSVVLCLDTPKRSHDSTCHKDTEQYERETPADCKFLPARHLCRLVTQKNSRRGSESQDAGIPTQVYEPRRQSSPSMPVHHTEREYRQERKDDVLPNHHKECRNGISARIINSFHSPELQSRKGRTSAGSSPCMVSRNFDDSSGSVSTCDSASSSVPLPAMRCSS
jgi:hypothetical protein